MRETLTEEHIRQIIQHLEENTHLTESCPSCGGTNFAIQDRLRYMPSVTPGGDVNMQSGGVYFEVTCFDCGASQLYNTQVIDGLDLPTRAEERARDRQPTETLGTP